MKSGGVLSIEEGLDGVSYNFQALFVFTWYDRRLFDVIFIVNPRDSESFGGFSDEKAFRGNSCKVLCLRCSLALRCASSLKYPPRYPPSAATLASSSSPPLLNTSQTPPAASLFFSPPAAEPPVLPTPLPPSPATARASARPAD